MAVDVTTSTVIRAPREAVAAYACDPDRAPDWYQNISSVEWQTERPLRQGTRIAFVAQFLGRRLAYTYEVVELVEGARLVMRTAEGPFPMETSYTFADAEDGRTLMELRNRGEPRGFSRALAPVMKSAMRRANEKDLAQLRGLLERR